MEEAFRYMSSGKHTGKVLIQMREEPAMYKPTKSVNLVPVTAITRPVPWSQKSYLITGGLGGFGFELTRWLVRKGAKKLVVLRYNKINI